MSMHHPTRNASRALALTAVLAAALAAATSTAQAQTPTPAPLTAQPATTEVAPVPTPAPAVTASGQAAAAQPPEAARAPAGATTVRLPLRELIGAEEPIYLINASSVYTVYLPLSARYNVRSAKLHLRFTNSIALLSERSVLRVVVNQRVVAQFYLTRDKPDHVANIEIPIRYLEVGSNEVQFIVAQHYTLECEDPGAPELWTQILPDESYFEAVVTWNPIEPTLALLRDIIDQKLWETYRFHICAPNSGGGMSDNQLAWGSVITQGVALNLSTRPFAVTAGNALLAGADNIVVGTMNELTQYLTATEIGSINGAFIGVKPLPGDPTRALVILSGRSDEEVGQACYAFSLVNFPLPDSQFVQIDRTAFPDKPFWVRNAPIEDPGIYSFRQLGFLENRSVKGWNTEVYQINAYMPGDLSPDDGSNIELRLHFAYGAAFRSDSVLNIFVNREFQFAIRLDDLRGARHWNHRVYLPAKAFQPGRNVIEIAPKMVPLHTNHCELIQIENLWFTLYRDSDFVVPRLLKQVRLPSFGLFSQTAYPFTSSPDGTDLAVHVAGGDPTTACSAWMLLGKISQISGTVLHRAEISSRLPRSKRNVLVVGPVNALPDELMVGSPVSPQEASRLRYLVSTSPKPEATAIGPVQEIIEKLRGQPIERDEPEQPSTVEMTGRSQLRDDMVAISFESPFHLGQVAAVFTAADPDKVYRGIFTLQNRRFWDNLSGNLAVWNTEPRSLETARIGPEFVYGVDSVIRRTTNRFNQDPMLFAAVLFAAIVLLALILFKMIKGRAKPDAGAGSPPAAP